MSKQWRYQLRNPVLFHDKSPKFVSSLVSVPWLPSLNWEEQKHRKRDCAVFKCCWKKKGEYGFILYGEKRALQILALRVLMVTYREGQCLCGPTESIYSIIGCQERNCGIARGSQKW